MRDLKITYTEVVQPIKNASFKSSGGTNVILHVDKFKCDNINEARLRFNTDTKEFGFNKSDLNDLIDILQKFHDQM